MKITYNEKETKQFKELKPSDVFFYDYNMIMVTETIEDSYGDYYNAVDLSTGDIITIEDNTVVELVDYEFRVNK